MEITIKGKVSADPRDRVRAIEAVTRSICEKTGQDPAEAVMMLLTAAAHIHRTYAKESPCKTALSLASSLGHAIAAADGFFRIAAAPTPPGAAQNEERNRDGR